MTRTSLARARLPRPAVLAAIAGAWALCLAAELTGRSATLHHDRLVEGRLAPWLALGLFLVAWQVMIAAMMLPTSLPLLALFDRVSAPQPAHRRARLAFLGGYVAVWTAFGALGFLFDGVVHRTVDATPWLAQRPWLIGGATLVVAGAFQFSDLKDRCLRQCRHPGLYLQQHYRRGVGAAFRLGRGHGLFCLGCCWALMLLAFAVGVANLAWMATLTAIMVAEKTAPAGRRVVRPVGVALLALGALVLVHPGWLWPPVTPG
jgi:predicted metal-binding membrane protein